MIKKISRSTHTISKVLSANDVGKTGAHQAGILVPKDLHILTFFPQLEKQRKNPRAHLKFTDDEGGDWSFAFIYYNNKFFGGTRNEYRLTHMTPYFRQNNLKPGDEITLSDDRNGQRYITFKRFSEGLSENKDILRVGSGWKVIKIKELRND